MSLEDEPGTGAGPQWNMFLAILVAKICFLEENLKICSSFCLCHDVRLLFIAIFCVSHILEAHDFIHWSKLFRCYWPTSLQQWWFGRRITDCRWPLIREVIREMQYFILFPFMSCPIFALQWFAYRHIWQIPSHGIPCVFSIWPIDLPPW